MMYRTPLVAAACSFIVSACAAPIDPVAEEIARDQAQYNAFVDARRDAITVDLNVDTSASSSDLLSTAPTNDTAQLNGAYTLNADSAISPRIEGEMRMNVNFGNNTVSGSLHNNYHDPDHIGESSVVELDGSVGFSGNIDMDPSGGFVDSTNTTRWQMEASGADTLTDTPVGGDTATIYRVDIDINGNFYDTSAVGNLAGVGEVGDLASAGQIEGNLDVTSAGDSTIYDITSGSYFVYELE
ncbi:hypothetical protein Q4544_01565 [Cognatishimia sp. 1_MG-2023]|uniref:hypothetical protein n=1 Tax=Cognatishimia sp. 1_MG-2023 TaxID=3062642 RepID=UPI0026E36C0F|nr:hypothetical protein [Cognatishimia sp. 1_MG-2023]MDO6725608.1 hypothetical protein [Cognatishimia sp. 1_MG-2023]